MTQNPKYSGVQEHLGLMTKRLEVLVGSKVAERDRMKAAAERIKSSIKKVKGFDAVAAIRKMREERK